MSALRVNTKHLRIESEELKSGWRARIGKVGNPIKKKEDFETFVWRMSIKQIWRARNIV